MTLLRDLHGRQFEYIRLSLTEVCNFRCNYCLPNGYKSSCKSSPLSENEVIHLVQAFAGLGINKVRFTGGEPTVRHDLVSLVKSISKVTGIKKIALTTNGHRLINLAEPLYNSGLTNINVSVDSLDDTTFCKITGRSLLKHVLAGVERAINAGIPTVKINSVLLSEVNDKEVPNFLNFVKDRKISVRFIELMQTGNNKEYFHRHHISTKIIDSYLRDLGWTESAKQSTDGPATEFTHPNYLGRIGTISPYSKDFCKSCNRLRISSLGKLQLCLFGQGQLDIRHLLQQESQRDELQFKIMSLLSLKPAGHDLHSGHTGATRNLSMIGG